MLVICGSMTIIDKAESAKGILGTICPRYFWGALFAIFASSSSAALVEWGSTLDAGLISKSNSVVYSNVNGEGYDIVVTTLNLNGEGAGNFGIAGGPVSSWWFEGQKNSLGSSVTFQFFETGTTTAAYLTGVHFQFEDAEVGEQFANFGYWDNSGTLQFASSSSSIFSGSSPGLNASLPSNYLQNDAAYESQTQMGKALDVDLSGVPISGFRFTPLRSNSTAGSVEMTGLGDVERFVAPVPEPGTALFGLGIVGALGLARRRASRTKR